METTKIDLTEYKQKLLDGQGWICPVTQMYENPEDLFILFVNDHDWAISKEGLNKLRIKYGAQFINDKIVHTLEVIENNLVRDKG